MNMFLIVTLLSLLPFISHATACLSVVEASTAKAYKGITKKQTFSISSFRTVGGKTIPNLVIGFETYGKMNSAGTNVIFVAHHYSGNSHAAGKYTEADKAPGYWDAIIGSGKAIDTDKYFVVSADTLTNLYPFDPNVRTTGPASINPETNLPYGNKFPSLTTEDFVRAHRALLNSLGVKSLHAVAGASAGSMLAFTWAVQYPRFVKRVLGVITPGLSVVGTDAQTQLKNWAHEIYQDPAFRNGDYSEQPILGLSRSLALTSYNTSINVDEKNNWSQNVFKTDWAHVTDQQKIDFYAAKMKTIDANNLLYTIDTYANYDLEKSASKIKAKVMMVPASSDKLFPPAMAERSREILLAKGVAVEPVLQIQGTGGHLDGILQITQASDSIKRFLNERQ